MSRLLSLITDGRIRLYVALILKRTRHYNPINFFFSTVRVQKKLRLHGSETEENFALYDVFEEGFEICMNNPVSAKFLYKATSPLKGIAHLQ